MAKSIHERVRAKLEKAERDAKNKIRRAQCAVSDRTDAAALRAAKREQGILDGSIEPRTQAEHDMAFRAEYGDCMDELL